MAPYTTPDDLDAIRASKAVITTSGGLLSHAAITTRVMGIPAAILPGVEWKDGGASLADPDDAPPSADEGLDVAAQSAMEAVKSGDAKAFRSAIEDMFSMLEARPHPEAAPDEGP